MTIPFKLLITTVEAQYDFAPIPAPPPPPPPPRIAVGPPAPTPPRELATAARPEIKTPQKRPPEVTRGPVPPPQTTRGPVPPPQTTRGPVPPLAVERPKTIPAPSAPSARCSVSDVLFVLDATGSVRGFFEQQKNYIIDVAQQMTIGPEAQHVGLILYSSKYRKRIIVEMDETPTKEQFIEKVRALPFYSGVTATGAALELSLTALEKRRKDKKTAVVVLTDGYSFDHVDEGAKKINALQNVISYVAGVADPYGINELEIIAGDGSRVLIGTAAKANLISVLRC